MNKTLKVAQREYLETVKTKTFLIGLFVTPVITVGIIFFANRISRTEGGPRPPVKVAVTDYTGKLSQKIKTAFGQHNNTHPKRQTLFQKLETEKNTELLEEQGKTRLREGKIDAYLIINEDVLEGSDKVSFYTHKPKPANLDAFWAIERTVNKTIIDERCKLRNLSPEVLAEIRTVSIERLELGSGKDEQRAQSEAARAVRMMVPFFFMFLIYGGIVGIGQQMLSSIIEEKNSRVIEVLLSAVNPFQLMAGKILGLVGIGLTVIGLWAIAAYVAAIWHGLNIEITGALVFYFVAYYVLGFLLFSSILAGIGSVCNTLKETQSLMMPIVLVFILPMISWYKLVQSPDGAFARILSFVPPLTPMVMMLRLSAGAEVWFIEILASFALLLGTVLAAIWLAAKIFRTGVLMYGKRPSLHEVLRWLRQA